MLKQNLISKIFLTVLLTLQCQSALANSLSSEPSVSSSGLQIIQNQPYDQAKESSSRRGTENWEQSQESFFVIPGLVIGIVGLLLFFQKGKAD